MPVYESHEGRDDDTWPPSPPLQSLHFEEKSDGRRVALLVGMAGRSHWSASIEADPAAGQILFDIACRVQQEPRWLGSTYRDCSENPLTPGEGRVRVKLLEPAAVMRENDAERTIEVPLEPGLLPRTFRWRYAVSVAQ